MFEPPQQRPFASAPRPTGSAISASALHAKVVVGAVASEHTSQGCAQQRGGGGYPPPRWPCQSEAERRYKWIL